MNTKAGNKTLMDARRQVQKLPESLQATVDRYLHLVRSCFADELEAVVLHGRVLSPDFRPGRDAMASVLVPSRIRLDHVLALSRLGEKLGALGFSAPLVMTPHHLRESLDSFPLEILDVHLLHLSVHGSDPFADLTFNPADVRLQCEREVKGVMIRMVQGLLASGGKEFLLSDVERDVAEVLLRALRATLWLQGQRENLAQERVLKLAEEHLSRPLVGLRLALDDSAQQTWEDFVKLYEDLEALAHRINHPPKQGDGEGA